MTRIVRPLRSGQITIPAEFRKQLGLTDDTLLQITLHSDELRVKPLRVAETAAGSPWMRQLYDLFAPVRDEAKELPEEEIDAAIDRAVAAVRKRHAKGSP